MAEIKSAIELAMEKTRDLVVSSKEREEMALKDVGDKVKAVLRRYMEEMIGPDDASKELNRINGDERIKKTVITDTLVEEFELHKNNERLLALFSVAGIELSQPLKNELEKIYQAFQEEVDARKASSRKRIMDKLIDLGISGNAIELNLDAWGEWHEDLERASDVFHQNMKSLKEKVKASNRNH
jgi:hypothetical protein